jgi:2',3'-cyclic-nucleotide 2'-phosphodiesterase (5'-nucleotidase family)
VQAGEYGEMLGRLDLVIDDKTGKIIQHRGELIPVTDEILLDEQTLKASESEKERAHALMQTRIGVLLTPYESVDDRECAAGNLLADALLAHVKKAQAAFIINGHWTNGLNAGVVTQGDLYTANRSAGNPACIKLTGAQIKQFLVNALKPENIEKKHHPMRGRATGWPHIAGMTVKVDKDDLEHIEILVNGQRLQPVDELIVAASDMEFSEILGYLSIPDDQIKFEVPTILPEVVEEYIMVNSPLTQGTCNRIQFI